jgi:glycosyltransferase involved in cell wall biosynthesis
LNIAICTHLSIAYMGGGEKEMCSLANELVTRGHEVDVYSLPYMMGAKPKAVPEEVLKGASYREAWTHKVKADVAYIFYHPFSSLNFRVEGRRIASFHSQAFFQKCVSRKYGLVPIAASYGTRIVGPLELRSFDGLHTHFPQPIIKHPQRFTIPHWVDTGVFKPDGKKNDEFTVLFSGRTLWQKGWDIYLALAKRMKELGIKFLYVGGFIDDANIQSLGFHSSDTTLSSIYNKAHALINPLRVETFGKVAIESMACGTPVVTAPSAGEACPSLPFVFGRTVDEYEASILKIKALWEDGRAYRQLSERCTTAAQAFSVDSVVSQYEDMFSTVAYAA